MPADDPRLDYVARTLRRARRDLDLSQEVVAHRAGMHANHVSAVERGTKDLRATTLMRIIEALGLTPAELFTRYGEPAPSAPAKVGRDASATGSR
jgi:transcriptional regulator with XRE-family HTH domain